MYISCSQGVTATVEQSDACGAQGIFVGLSMEAMKIVNTGSVEGRVEVELRAYRSDDRDDYESKKFVIKSMPSRTIDDSREGAPSTPVKISQDARISSFTLPSSVNSRSALTAYFNGENIDNWQLKLSCPLPTTVSGIEERIDMIVAKIKGVSSPSREGEICNVQQTAAVSLKQFTFSVVSPFKTPQQVSLTLRAQRWDGSKYITGETQVKTVMILPQ